jgi:glutamine amidotransferase
MIHPIIDEYYNYNPYHSRSSKFAVEKGLVTNEKSSTPRAESPMPMPNPTQKEPSLFQNKPSHMQKEPSMLQKEATLNQREPNLNKPLPPSKYQDNLFSTLTLEMHFPTPPSFPSRILTPESSSSPSLSSGPFSETSNAPTDIRRIAPLPPPMPPRPQEQGNTKKKRISMDSIRNMDPILAPAPEEQAPERPRTPEERTDGDLAKIAKFFPELNLERR